MVNHFSGIISSDFKQLFTDAISALLYDDACTLPCTLYYGITRYEDCANCIFDAVGNKSSNKFQDGGPMPFPFGQLCPMCNGAGKRGITSSDPINLMVIWDYKEFINVGTVNQPEGMIQTITFKRHTAKLKRAKEIMVATDLQAYAQHRFERMSEPQPCGLGNDEFVGCLWNRIG
jgi:hypothetical protein